VIARFGLGTPVREPEEAVAAEATAGGSDEAAFLAALGGAANIRALDACMTRLRVTLANPGAVDEATLRRLGARGFVRPTSDTLQVVVGPIADQLAGRMRRGLRTAAPAGPATPDIAGLLAALGGAVNVVSVEAASTRLLVAVADDARIDEAALAAASPRGFARPSSQSVQVLVGPGAATARDALARLAGAGPGR
jgi:PTS system N-acetylglucosamine-specific IIC component